MSNDSFKPLGPLRKRVDSSGVTQGIVDEQGETVSLGGAGSGDVTKVGTPANNQVGVWTGDGTLEGDSALTFDTSTDTLTIGASGNLAFGAVTVIDDNAGTTTLQNIDALDATTEATIEAAIDTLANLTSVQGVTVTLADAGADAIFGWDDSTGAYANLSAADARTALGLATTDSPQFTAVNVGAASDTTITRTGAGDIAVEGNAIYRAGGTDVPLADGGTGASLADPNADRIMFWDDSAGAVAWLTAGSGLSISGTSMTATATGFPTVEAIATGSAYTLTTGDANKIKLGQDSSAQTINITTAFDGLGCWIQWLAGAGTITLDANAGVNLNGLGDGVNIVLSQAAGMVQIIPTGTNTWNVVGAIGDLVASDVTDSGTTGRALLQSANSAAAMAALVAADPNADRIVFWDDSAGAAAYLSLGTGLSITNTTMDIDGDLQTIAGLTATTDNFIQSSSSAWASRTPLQAAATLVGTGLDVDMLGNRGLPINSQSAAYTTVAADSGKTILHPSSDNNARTFTIDSNANVAYEVGTTITFVNKINTVTIAITSDTLTLAGAGTTGSRTLAANGIATALKISTTEWIINGTGLT